jgi:hypothetical protein
MPLVILLVASLAFAVGCMVGALAFRKGLHEGREDRGNCPKCGAETIKTRSGHLARELW